jgi:hypothetical protein
MERGLLSLLAGGESDPFPVSVRDQPLIFQLEQDRTGNPDEEGKLLHKARTSRSLRLIGLPRVSFDASTLGIVGPALVRQTRFLLASKWEMWEGKRTG